MAAILGRTPMERKPSMFGIYGLPGAGKSYLLNALQQALQQEGFKFTEGSALIADITGGGFQNFNLLPKGQKASKREEAIRSFANCLNKGENGVIAGHFMFWPEGEVEGTTVWTRADLSSYTHIIYLDTPPDVIHQRCQEDTTRNRTLHTVTHLQKWQAAEKAELRKICYANSILFSVLRPEAMTVPYVSDLLLYISRYNEGSNRGLAEERLEESIRAQGQRMKSMLVLDGDKTMAAKDTGSLFWQNICNRRGEVQEGQSLKALFSSKLGYSHGAFRQAACLYEEWTDATEFEEICTEIAAHVQLYPEIKSLLEAVRAEEHAGAIVITCGIHLIWQKILEREGFADKVQVFGNGRFESNHGLIVDPEVKATLVTYLRTVHKIFVTALGDSVMDLPMLYEADQGVVVVGDEQSRSKRMDEDLAAWIDTEDLRVRQAILKAGATPRLDDERLPQVSLTDHSFIKSMFPYCPDLVGLQVTDPRVGLQVHDLTESNAAKILMTPTKDATKAGQELQSVHCDVGWYLAMNIVTEAIGVEECEILHVQGNKTTGHRLANEHQTLIVALMRGGEPMARGVLDAFPLATFLHANQHEDITAKHLEDKATVLLVDSVVNSGETMIDFIRHVNDLKPGVRMVIMAGVTQVEAIGKLEDFQKSIRHKDISLITLRKSDNSFKGKGGTDTGNRLFNTVNFD